VGVAAQRLFRNGILVTPELTLTRNPSYAPLGTELSAADVGVTVSVPLLRDRWGSVSAARERAAARDQQSSVRDLEHTVAQTVVSAAIAYWDYLAARRSLDVYVSSEQRAQQAVEKTRILVEADERTPAALQQMEGNLASKRVSRIAAEQAVSEARHQLGLAMGLDVGTTLAPPSTDFPRPAREGEQVDTARLVQEAYARRADLAATSESLRSSEIQLAAAQSEARARLDVVAGAGYTGTQTRLGLRGFFSALDPQQRLFNMTAQLKLEFPPSNSGARGRLQQNVSAVAQRHILESDLKRRIALEVAVAAEALARNEASMKESEQAVVLFEAGVRAVRRLFELGEATLFDLIQAEDALTNAQLGRVRSQRAYAAAVATLRFESGRFTDLSQRPSEAAQELLTPP
jgi:outer membrane protein